MTDQRNAHEPVFMIGVASRLCGVHPQTLRTYERLGLINPARVHQNRIYSEHDVLQVKRIQRLTQDLGVNLAGVEIILKLLDQMDEMKADYEDQIHAYVREAEHRIAQLLKHSNSPVRKDEMVLPVPKIRVSRRIDL